MKAILQAQIDDCSDILSDINDRLHVLSPFDKLIPYLTQYALIKACGTVEFVYRSIVADYFDQFGICQIDKYLDKNVRQGSMSPKYEKMNELLKAFDDTWSDSFRNAVNILPDKNRIISSADSLVRNRHLLAHGRVPTATFNEIMNYYNDVIILIQILDSIVV